MNLSVEQQTPEALPWSCLGLQPLGRATARMLLGTCVLGISTGAGRKRLPGLAVASGEADTQRLKRDAVTALIEEGQGIV